MGSFPRERPANRHCGRRVSDGTRTRDRLDHNQGVELGGFRANTAWEAGFARIGRDSAVVDIPVDTGR
jgi:hypothetical protein